MGKKKMGVFCAWGAMMLGLLEIQATPLAELKAFLSERSIFWVNELAQYTQSICRDQGPSRTESLEHTRYFAEQLMWEIEALLRLVRTLEAAKKASDHPKYGEETILPLEEENLLREAWLDVHKVIQKTFIIPEISREIHAGEETRSAELEDFLLERTNHWRVELRQYIREMRKPLAHLLKTEKSCLWDSIRKILLEYPFLEKLWGKPPRISLLNGLFFGTELEWWAQHWRRLRQCLGYIKYFSERLVQEVDALLLLTQLTGDTEITAELIWRKVRMLVYGSPHRPTSPGEANFRAEKQGIKYKEQRQQQDELPKTDFGNLKEAYGDPTQEIIAEFLRQNEESIPQLEAALEKILQEYDEELELSFSIFEEKFE
jgi:hypothetical protein